MNKNDNDHKYALTYMFQVYYSENKCFGNASSIHSMSMKIQWRTENKLNN